MIEPTLHEREDERLRELKSYSILDSLPESDYDNLTTIAAQICGTPISLVSLVDDKRQWFKSHIGLAAEETPKEYAFCAHAINKPDEIFIVPDSRTDVRFHDNPLVTDEPLVIFYAGVPLTAPNGLPLGTLCVIDHEPRELNQGQINSLKALSTQVMSLLELRKAKKELQDALINLETKNTHLERFAFVAAHDIKSPLSSITMLSDLVTKQYANLLDEEGKTLMNMIHQSSCNLRELVDGLLNYTKCESLLRDETSSISFQGLIEEVCEMVGQKEDIKVKVITNLKNIEVHQTAMQQVFLNLVGNAVKYNHRAQTILEIGGNLDKNFYHFYVQDNGPGIKPNYQKSMFKMFEIGEAQDKYGKRGNGIGLATVKRIVESLNGEITYSYTPEVGSRFSFMIEMGK